MEQEKIETRDFDREIKDKKAEAWDLRLKIDELTLRYQQALVPLEGKLNNIVQEIEQIKRNEMTTQPPVKTDGNKIMVGKTPGAAKSNNED